MSPERKLIMASATYTLIDINGNESSETLPSGGVKIGDLLGANQQALVDGTIMTADTTVRGGDTVEIIAKSGKAGLIA